MTKPITPRQALKTAESAIPDLVFQVFNRLISDKAGASTTGIVLKQVDVVAALELEGLTRAELYAKHWLDVEPHYRKAGWDVLYDKPGYNEDYDAFWRFTPKAGE